MLKPVYRNEPPVPKNPVWIIVQGAKVGPRGKLSKSASERWNEAKRAYSELVSRGEEPVMVLSGGRPFHRYSSTVSEAEALKQAALGDSFPGNRLLLEPHSLDSIGSAVLCAQLAKCMSPEYKPKRVIVVTSPYHVERATKLFKHMFFGSHVPVKIRPLPVARVDANFMKRMRESEALANKRLTEPGGFLASVRRGKVNEGIEYLTGSHDDREAYSRVLDGDLSRLLPPLIEGWSEPSNCSGYATRAAQALFEHLPRYVRANAWQLRDRNIVTYENPNPDAEPLPSSLSRHVRPGNLIGIFMPNSPYNRDDRRYTHVVLAAAKKGKEIIIFQNNRHGVDSPMTLREFLKISGGKVIEVLAPPVGQA
jgi:uncharacterized SAM-binding protein YcdF (DUF218 family)